MGIGMSWKYCLICFLLDWYILLPLFYILFTLNWIHFTLFTLNFTHFTLLHFLLLLFLHFLIFFTLHARDLGMNSHSFLLHLIIGQKCLDLNFPNRYRCTSMEIQRFKDFSVQNTILALWALNNWLSLTNMVETRISSFLNLINFSLHYGFR